LIDENNQIMSSKVDYSK